MKKTAISLALAGVMALGFTADAKSVKRGVCHNNFGFIEQMQIMEPGISWYYSWGTVPQAETDYCSYNDVEFVPMIWGRYQTNEESYQKVRDWCREHPETKYLLGFNEPNFGDQANMTPQEAAELWPQVVALAKECGLKLVAPALNFSAGTYASPTKWMDEFVAIVGLDSFDYTAIHSYGGYSITCQLAEDFHNRYGKDVWLTEFCDWSSENVSQSAQVSFMQPMIGWLETTPWIFRYAWFMATGASNSSKGPNYGLVEAVINTSTLQTEGYRLSQQGQYYVYLPYADPAHILSVGQTAGVDQCSGFRSCKWSLPVVDGGEASTYVTEFGTGGYLDFMFDVPQAGDYFLRLKLGGYGEPTYFDPVFTISTVDELGNVITTHVDKESVATPNSDTDRLNHYFALSLPAGNQRVRVASDGFTSGVTIHDVMLADQAGIDTLAPGASDHAIVDVFNIAGVKVRAAVPRADALNDLPSGFYIVGTDKVFVR